MLIYLWEVQKTLLHSVRYCITADFPFVCEANLSQYRVLLKTVKLGHVESKNVFFKV